MRVCLSAICEAMPDRLAIYQQLSMFDFGFTETDVLGNILWLVDKQILSKIRLDQANKEKEVAQMKRS